MTDSALWETCNEIPAEVYERYWVPAIFAPWARLHIARASLHPGERVLDVACGTGVVARLAAEIVGPAGRVTGLDISPGLLEVARTLDSGQQVEWHEGDALSLPFANSSFDSALLQHGLQQFPDRIAGLREMHRVLRPGGSVVVSTWGRLQESPAWATLLTTRPERMAGGHRPANIFPP